MRREGGLDAFLGWVETFIVFPARLVGVGFRSVAERWMVGVDSRELAEFLPSPVCIIVAEMLDIAITMSDVETRLCLVPHHDARGQKGRSPESRCDHLGRIQEPKT